MNLTKTIGGLLIAGILIIAATRFFQFQTRVGSGVIGRVQSKDPQQIVVAAAITVALGLAAVVVGQAFRKVT